MVINPTDSAFTNNAFSDIELVVAEVLVKAKEAGTFVVRNSTSYRGSFGLAMKVEPGSAGKLSDHLDQDK